MAVGIYTNSTRLFWVYPDFFYYDHSSGVDFTLGIVALLLSHIISFLLVMLSFVFAVLIISMFQRTFWPHFRKLLISGILGMGCTAFFWVKFVQVYFSNNINGVVKLDSSLYALKPSNVVIDSLNNTSITSNVGLIILIVGLCLLASKGGLAKLDNYVLYGALICAFLSSSLFPWIHVQKYLGGVIQYPVRLLSLAMVGFAFVAADYINSYLVKVGGIHRAIIIVGFGFVVLMMVTSSSTELANYLNTKNQLRTPSQNVLATSWNKFDAHAAKYIFNEKFAMAGEYDYWPKQSMKFSNDIVDHIGKINGHKQRMEPRSITDGIRYKVALRKGDVIDLPFLNYGDGFKISDGFKITKSDRGTVQTRATKSVRSIIVRRRNGILDYCTLLVSIASWVLLAIILAFSRRFRLVRMNGTFHL
ncbi:hypothetical protein [Lacticaseibacillus thailandensis]|uniref:hypothetical protein n=1 Tax=Lacticaseibacillus thailandensis TaxID=381741 RepID=UPI000B1EB858|nr:hypothetical protein [Lacticaseibacillus thailandensis]